MKLVFGGVRGTSPVAQADFLKYGGETTSVLIEGHGGEKIIIDAGTGLRTLGARLTASGAKAEALLLMTHYHPGPLKGLPSFASSLSVMFPIFRPSFTARAGRARKRRCHFRPDA